MPSFYMPKKMPKSYFLGELQYNYKRWSLTRTCITFQTEKKEKLTDKRKIGMVYATQITDLNILSCKMGHFRGEAA